MMLKMNLKSLPRISALQPLYRMPLSLVIEAWITPLSAITPSLVLHNLELAGIQLPHSLTVTIDRGHYDCMDTNYAVIVVDTTSPIRLPLLPSQSVCCSFFSHSVTRDTDPGALHSHWIGNCYMHIGYNREAMCSYRHEPGRAKTWKRVDTHDETSDAGSVEPEPVSVENTKTKTKTKTKLKIIQLQKKVLLLRTELDVWKAEVRDLKAELSTVKADQDGLAQRHKEQEAWVKRANHCMQDWTHQQVIERLRILENAVPASVPAAANPFDFKQICDYADMPALDLIATHYQCASNNNTHNSDGSDDDDCFIQVVVEK